MSGATDACGRSGPPRRRAHPGRADACAGLTITPAALSRALAAASLLALASCSERPTQFSDMTGRWQSEGVTLEFQESFLWGKSISYESSSKFLPRMFKAPVTNVATGKESRILYFEMEMFGAEIRCQVSFSRDRSRINISDCLSEVNGSWSKV